MSKSQYYISIFILLIARPCFAGSGLYFGGDVISHQLDTQVEVNQTFSSPPPEAINVSNSVAKKFTDFGARIGYKYKRRLNHHFFMTPELAFSELDNDFIYSTNFKIGVDVSDFSFYGIAGASHINQFDKNQFNYGLGIEYKLSRIISLNLEWQQFDTMSENTLFVENFNEQISTTTIDTQRDVTAIKLGITVYFHE